eukprot:5307529-Pyramimonas_sp.AAC.1
MSKEALQDLVRQPWLSMDIDDVEGFENAEEARELLRALAQSSAGRRGGGPEVRPGKRRAKPPLGPAGSSRLRGTRKLR